MTSRQSPIASLEPYLVEKFVRGSGPGGQNVNKVATAVDLRLNVPEAPLSDEARERLRAITENTDGFEIAERDLLLWGPGDFFGTRQAGG